MQLDLLLVQPLVPATKTVLTRCSPRPLTAYSTFRTQPKLANSQNRFIGTQLSASVAKNSSAEQASGSVVNAASKNATKPKTDLPILYVKPETFTDLPIEVKQVIYLMLFRPDAIDYDHCTAWPPVVQFIHNAAIIGYTCSPPQAALPTSVTVYPEGPEDDVRDATGHDKERSA